MKKLFLTLTAAVALTFAANAQTEKGKTMLGGNVSYNYDKVKDADNATNAFEILPSVGIFVSDNFAVGTAIGYAYEETATKQETGAFKVAPFARLYKGDSNFKFFGQLSVPMAWGNAKNDGDKIGTTESYGVELSPGFAYFPTEKIGIELSVKGLHYTNSSTKPEGGEKASVNSFGLNANSLAPRIGVQFYF